jgi:type II secretory pathway pseudopilin PulG
MDPIGIVITVVVAIVGVAIGAAVGNAMGAKRGRAKQRQEMEAKERELGGQARTIIQEAEAQAKDTLLKS